jgi:uncharacterized membrane protein
LGGAGVILRHRQRSEEQQFAPIQLLRDFWTWPLVVSIALVALVAAPGPLHHAAHGALHGLCAQQPTHTFVFGERYLPFDARMTGIYGGVLITLGWFAAHGRLRCWATPSRSVVLLLVGAVASMAIDGTNSLLRDLQLWHPYQPTNLGRLVTGLGSGVAMATLLTWLFAPSVWTRGQGRSALRSPRELAEIALLCCPYAYLILMEPGWLYLPVTLMLLGSAWLTLTLLMFVMVVLFLRRDGTFSTGLEMHVPVLGASILALGVMLGLAGGRFWVERTLGIVATM